MLGRIARSRADQAQRTWDNPPQRFFTEVLSGQVGFDLHLDTDVLCKVDRVVQLLRGTISIDPITILAPCTAATSKEDALADSRRWRLAPL